MGENASKLPYRILTGLIVIGVLEVISVTFWANHSDFGEIDRHIRNVPFEIQHVVMDHGGPSIKWLIKCGKPAVPSLTSKLRSRNPLMAGGCAYVLGEIGTPAARALGELARAIRRDGGKDSSKCDMCFEAIRKISQDDPRYIDLAADLLAAGSTLEARNYLRKQSPQLVRKALGRHLGENVGELSTTFIGLYLSCDGDPDPLATEFRNAISEGVSHRWHSLAANYLRENPEVRARFVSQWLDDESARSEKLEDYVTNSLYLLGATGTNLLLAGLRSDDSRAVRRALGAVYRMDQAPPELVAEAWNLLPVQNIGLSAGTVIIRNDPQALEHLSTRILEGYMNSEATKHAIQALGINSKDIGPEVVPVMFRLLAEGKQACWHEVYQFLTADYGFEDEIEQLLPQLRQLVSDDSDCANWAFLIVACHEYGASLLIGERDLNLHYEMRGKWLQIAAQDGDREMRRRARFRANQESERIAKLEAPEAEHDPAH